MPRFDDPSTEPLGIISDLDGPGGMRLEDWVRRKRPPWRRALQSAFVTIALVALILTIVRPSWWQLLGGHPAMAAQPAAHVVIITSDINAGTLILNGRAYVMQPGMQIALKDGANSLELLAPPFAPLSCTVNFPPTNGFGPCQSSYNVANGNGYAPVVNLNETLENLPTIQQKNLQQTIALALASPMGQVQTTVPAGQHYGIGGFADTGVPLSRVATTNLQAILFALPQASMSCEDFITSAICPASFTNSLNTSDGLQWLVQVPVQLGWYFTNRTTRQTTTTILTTFGSQDTNGFASTPLKLLLSYVAPDIWEVVLDIQTATQPNVANQLAQLHCELGIAQLSALFGENSDQSGFAIAIPATVDGCAISTQTSNSGTYIERFGVLLAANTIAHHQKPALPVASPDEITAAEAGE